MTDNVKKELEHAKSEEVVINHELDKYKGEFAESLLKNKDVVIDSIIHPYVPTKRDKRRLRWMKIKNNIKKVLGLNDTENK